MQRETADPTEVPLQRLRRAEAAAYARRRLGQSVTINTLRSWPILYRQVGRDAVYEISDLDRFIDARLEAAPRRRAPGGRQIGEPEFAAICEERRKLLVGSVGDEEAKLRAFEHTVGEYRRRHGGGLDEAKTAVLKALARQKERV
jgi:hypothetical protein